MLLIDQWLAHIFMGNVEFDADHQTPAPDIRDVTLAF